jgi:hypothetical protein
MSVFYFKSSLSFSSALFSSRLQSLAAEQKEEEKKDDRSSFDLFLLQKDSRFHLPLMWKSRELLAETLATWQLGGQKDIIRETELSINRKCYNLHVCRCELFSLPFI